jgi:hypothetical protein
VAVWGAQFYVPKNVMRQKSKIWYMNRFSCTMPVHEKNSNLAGKVLSRMLIIAATGQSFSS